ncbi:MAG: hypothetical protein ACTTIC_04390 [Helicobacteraceae bacterium]
MIKVFKFRLTQDLRARLKLISSKQNKSQSLIVRYALENFLKTKTIEESAKLENIFILLQELSIDLSRVPSNLNQIAHKLNMDESVDLARISVTINELYSLVKETSANLLALKKEIKQTRLKGMDDENV